MAADRPAESSTPSTTWKKPGAGTAAARTRLPCLTLCGHAELGRIGERALLQGLLVRSTVAVSRVELDFAAPGAQHGRPLEDPYLSRTKLLLSGDPRRELTLRYERDDLRVDGEPCVGELTLGAGRLAQGVVLELAERVVLLLHLVDGTTPVETAELPGLSDGMEAVRREVARIAALEVPVLIRGESGSGKERVAQALHRQGARAARPLVTVNMAAVASSTAASVLFGHARGAFTGAVNRHDGLFEQADHATLFLDEIGETPDEVQPMLLRVLETGRFMPLGDHRERHVDVRVLAATDADLEQDAGSGRFRPALLHRLAGYELWVPPLRERRDDIARLFVRFLREELTALGDGARLDATRATDGEPFIPPSLIARLLRHLLHGNVRQLRNLVRRLALASVGRAQLVVDATAERILDHDVSATQPPPAGSTAPSQPAPSQPASQRPPPRKPSDISDLELLAALETNGWSPRRTAAALAIPTSTVHDLMRRCPSVRKAKDIEDVELRQALVEADGDLDRMAAALRVSERALRITLRERKLITG